MNSSNHSEQVQRAAELLEALDGEVVDRCPFAACPACLNVSVELAA